MGAERPISSGSIVFDEVAAAIGVEATVKLCRLYAARRIYVPAEFMPHHEVFGAIGADAAERFASFFHGTYITFPARIGEKAAVLKLAAQGTLTKAAIAAEVGISERKVYRLLAEADDRQGDLFASPDE